MDSTDLRKIINSCRIEHDICQLNGLSEEIIEAKIRTSKCSFDTAPATLKNLKDSEVSDRIILAMIEASATRIQPSDDSKAPEEEPGVYRFPRVFITSNQKTDTHGTYYGDLSGVYGNVDTTNALNSSPKIAEKIQSKAPS